MHFSIFNFSPDTDTDTDTAQTDRNTTTFSYRSMASYEKWWLYCHFSAEPWTVTRCCLCLSRCPSCLSMHGQSVLQRLSRRCFSSANRSVHHLCQCSCANRRPLCSSSPSHNVCVCVRVCMFFFFFFFFFFLFLTCCCFLFHHSFFLLFLGASKDSVRV